SVKTTKVDPISIFFVPVLRLADRYDIAVGYFSTAWIRDAAEGIAHFASNGGKARWMISPELSIEDYETFRDASGQLDEDKIDELVIRSFDRLFQALREDTRTVLAWLIRDGVMKFRIGVPKNQLSGMMHAKMGVFRDSQGHRIGFNGSYNLTSHA